MRRGRRWWLWRARWRGVWGAWGGRGGGGGRGGVRSPPQLGSGALGFYFLHLLDRFFDHAGRLAGLDLALNRDKPSVASVESSRKDRGDIEGDGWIASKNRRRVGDIELTLLQSPHVCRMGLV